MPYRKLMITVGKVILSGVLAFIILTIFCIFYSNTPVHYDNPDGATDYIWEPHVFYSHGTEGFAWGKTNNEGYMNMFDYDENMQIDILIMGSSHMEANAVAMDENTASRLNSLLEEDTVYNIGVSGHTFLTCACNLNAAINKYKPTRYIVIVTDSISFSEQALSDAINGSIAKIPSHSGGIIGLLQRNQYLRLIYSQINNYMEKQARDKGDIENIENIENVENNANGAESVRLENNELLLLDTLLQKMSTSVGDSDTKIIIVYHPSTIIKEDGSLQLVCDKNLIDQFQKLCNNNSILFLDMSDRFIKEYESAYVLPYGFSNTSVGSGHLNKYGHTMIADELYKLIAEVE